MSSTICGWCGQLTHMTLAGDVFQLPLTVAAAKRDNKVYAAAFSCDNEACRKLSIGQSELPAGLTAQGDLRIELTRQKLAWTPSVVSRPSFPDVPNEIADAASEAHACLSIRAYRGAVALARAVVEATAKEKGITKGSLAKKIDDLHVAGHIRAITKEVAHEVREGGNEIAHGDLGDEPMPGEDAQAIVRLMDEILQEVYQGPAAMLRLRKNREEREQRNAATT